MKQVIFVALVCLNAALLVALVFIANAPPAQAQVIGGGANYLVLTAMAADSYDALYVLDLATHQLTVWDFQRTNNRLRLLDRRQLLRDFGTPKTPEF